ncbi:MAG: putative exported protein [Herbaspirillum sp.]|nr:putative exported protein [Herbaspirillum sp.]
MKIIKPDNLALFYRTLQQGDDKLLSLGLMAMFRLDGAAPSAAPAQLLSEQQLWTLSTAALGDAVLDAGWPKPAGEFLAYGAYHAPAADAGRQLIVSISVGSIEKTLTTFDAPHGEHHFEALPATSPQRTSLLGSFNQQWLKKTWPHLPLDTAAAYFHSAPPDQRMAGFFKGDEAIEIANMHPQHALLCSALPQLRARCFVNRLNDAAEVFSEIETCAETVWLFPEQACGIVLYRGVTGISDSEADDVLHVMAQWERMDEAPQTFDYYRDFFARQLSGADEVADSAPASVATAAVIAVSPGIDAELTEMVSQMERDTQTMLQAHGLDAAAAEKYMSPPTEQPPMSALDMEQVLTKMENDLRDMMRQHSVSAADVEKLIAPQ